MKSYTGATLIATMMSCLIILALWACLGLLVSWVLMWAWNLLIPTLLHGPTITYLMAVALYFVLSLIAGAFKCNTSVTQKD